MVVVVDNNKIKTNFYLNFHFYQTAATLKHLNKEKLSINSFS